MRVLDHGAAVDDLDAGLLEIGPVDALEPVDLLVLVADQGRPVEAGLAEAPAEALRIVEIVGEAAGIDQQLLRHAAADHAGAADPILFRQHDLRAVSRRDPRRAHAAGAASDHKEVNIE